MNVSVGHKSQITVAPRCPACGSSNTATCRSKGITLEHEGEQCRAQQQYRKCRDCGENFSAIHIKGRVPDTLKPRKITSTGEWSTA